MNSEQQQALLKLAREAIQEGFEGKEFFEKERFQEKKAVFVSLYLKEQYHNSMGITETHIPIGIGIPHVARHAAFKDKKVEKIRKKEMNKLQIEISILEPYEEIKPEEYQEKIKEGYGLKAEYQNFNGIILPHLFTKGEGAQPMLNQICMKAGLLEDAWKNGDIKISRFKAETFKEQKQEE